MKLLLLSASKVVYGGLCPQRNRRGGVFWSCQTERRSDLPPLVSAAHVGAGHDGVQEEPASLPPGQASHQLHGCQTVSEAGRTTRSSSTGGRWGGRPWGTLPCFPPTPSSSCQEDSHLTEPALACVCVCVCLFARVHVSVCVCVCACVAGWSH